MTESEAREKWCPAVDVRSKDGENVTCIASDCMAWRWGHKDTLPAADGLHGYCGLAGKP